MNSNEMFDLIEKIAATSSKNDKVALVKANVQDSDFRRLLVNALNPLITYGIAIRPTQGGNGVKQFDDESNDFLVALSTRNATGNAAIATLTRLMDGMSPQSAELYWRVVSKDLKAGFGESTVNKAEKGLIPDFPYMRCCLPKDTKMHTFSWEEGVYSQEKADGMFANLNYEVGGPIIISGRSGQQFPMHEFHSLCIDVRLYMQAGIQMHGELLVSYNGKIIERSLSNGVMNRILDGGKLEPGEEIHYFVWDAIPLDAVVSKGSYKVPYKKRFGALQERMKGAGTDSALHLIDTRIVHSLPEAYAHYRDMLKKGKEGVVVKDGNAIWEDRTSKFQVKLKLEADVDLKVTAIHMGKPGSKVDGRPAALSCETSDGLLKVDVTVKNEAMRDWVERQPDAWIDSIIAVRANSILEPSDSNPLNSLFLPRMVEANYRTDKSEPDSLQRVRDQFEAAMAAA